MDYKLGKKMGGTQEELEAGLDDRNAQAMDKLRALIGGAPKTRPEPSMGTDIPQMKMENPPQKMVIREATLSAKPLANDGGQLANVLNSVSNADKMQQMKQLEEMEQVGAFEEPDSEANLRAAKLRALLGR